MKSNFRIIFLGDIALNDMSIEIANNDFNKIKKKLSIYNSDLIICNLESPLESDDGNVNFEKNPRLKTSKKFLELIKGIGIDIVILGNNHIYDCLENGIEETVSFLDNMNIGSVGVNYKDSRSCKVFKKEGWNINIDARVSRYTNPCIENNSKDVTLDYIEDYKAIQTHQGERFINIMSLHWGIEFSGYPTPLQRNMASEIINNGYDFVYGHHPHSLQGVESLGNKNIAYSLGNFYFGNLTSSTPNLFWRKNSRITGISVVDFDANGKNKIKLDLFENQIDNVLIKVSSLYKFLIFMRSWALFNNKVYYLVFWKIYQAYDSIIKPVVNYFFLTHGKSFLQQILSVRISDLKKIASYFSSYKDNTKNDKLG